MWKKEADKNVWQLLKCYTWIVISFFICVCGFQGLISSWPVGSFDRAKFIEWPFPSWVRPSPSPYALPSYGMESTSVRQRKSASPAYRKHSSSKYVYSLLLFIFPFLFLCIVCLFCVVGTCGVFEMIWSHHHHWPVFVFVFKTIDSEHNSSGPVPTTRRRQYGSCPGWYGFPQWNHIELFSTFHDDFHSNGKARLPSESNRYINYVTRNYFNTKKKTQTKR